MGFWGTLGKIGGSLLGPVGSVAGSVIDMISQDHANKANAQNVREQQAFQANQSATQHQREKADLEAAGYNPAYGLSAGGNNAATGNAATVQPTAQNSASKIAAAIDSYNQLANGTAQRQLMRAQTDTTERQAKLIGAQTTILNPEGTLATDPEYRDAYRRKRITETQAGSQVAEMLPEGTRLNMESTRQGIATARAQEALTRSAATLNEQQFTNEYFRKNILPYINSTAKALNLLPRF